MVKVENNLGLGVSDLYRDPFPSSGIHDTLFHRRWFREKNREDYGDSGFVRIKDAVDYIRNTTSIDPSNIKVQIQRIQIILEDGISDTVNSEIIGFIVRRYTDEEAVNSTRNIPAGWRQISFGQAVTVLTAFSGEKDIDAVEAELRDCINDDGFPGIAKALNRDKKSIFIPSGYFWDKFDRIIFRDEQVGILEKISHYHLSPTEYSVLFLRVCGKNNEQIRGRLRINSQNTLKRHFDNIRLKFEEADGYDTDVRSPKGFIAKALNSGLFPES